MRLKMTTELGFKRPKYVTSILGTNEYQAANGKSPVTTGCGNFSDGPRTIRLDPLRDLLRSCAPRAAGTTAKRSRTSLSPSLCWSRALGASDQVGRLAIYDRSSAPQAGASGQGIIGLEKSLFVVD
jgi:hypothetical protein